MARTRATTPGRSRTRAVLKVLADSGGVAALRPEEFGIAARDLSWGPYADNLLRANRPQFQALDLSAELVTRPGEISATVRAGGIAGAVPLRAPHTGRVAGGIVVRPRYGWDDIGALLSAIGWAAAPQLLAFPLVPGSAREVPPWVLAGPVVRRFVALLQEVSRGFRMAEETRPRPRGTVLWARYAREQLPRGRPHAVPCRFPDLGADANLRAYLRWGLEQLRRSLLPWVGADRIARSLVDEVDALLSGLTDVVARLPSHAALNELLRDRALSSAALAGGVEALGWLVDERGLAGRNDSDGLAWRLTMHELFERWVEHLTGVWAAGFGGTLTADRRDATTIPIRWQRPWTGSLSSLRPDVVVQTRDAVFIFDAKYKPHMEALDGEHGATDEAMRAEHRHDVHQVLAYAAAFDAPRVTAALVYPMRAERWQALAPSGRTVDLADVVTGGRSMRLARVAVPLRFPSGGAARDIAVTFGRLREDAESL